MQSAAKQLNLEVERLNKQTNKKSGIEHSISNSHKRTNYKLLFSVITLRGVALRGPCLYKVLMSSQNYSMNFSQRKVFNTEGIMVIYLKKSL